MYDVMGNVAAILGIMAAMSPFFLAREPRLPIIDRRREPRYDHQKVMAVLAQAA